MRTGILCLTLSILVMVMGARPARATVPCQVVCDDCSVYRHTLIPDLATDLPTNLKLPLVRPPERVRLVDGDGLEVPSHLEAAPGGYVTWLVPDVELAPLAPYVAEQDEYGIDSWAPIVSFETGSGSDLEAPAAPPSPLLGGAVDRYLCADHAGATLSFDATFPVGFLLRVVISTAGEESQELVLPYEPYDVNRDWPLNGKLYLGAYDAGSGWGDCLREVAGARAATPYTITASVIDLAGNASAPSAAVSFEFHPARASTEKMGACGCATVSGPATLPTLIILLGWALLRRHRRRGDQPKANPDCP